MDGGRCLNCWLPVLTEGGGPINSNLGVLPPGTGKPPMGLRERSYRYATTNSLSNTVAAICYCSRARGTALVRGPHTVPARKESRTPVNGKGRGCSPSSCCAHSPLERPQEGDRDAAFSRLCLCEDKAVGREPVTGPPDSGSCGFRGRKGLG